MNQLLKGLGRRRLRDLQEDDDPEEHRAAAPGPGADSAEVTQPLVALCHLSSIYQQISD